MNLRLRSLLFLVFAAVGAAAMVYAVGGLPQFGNFDGAYTAFILHATVPLRHIDNAATAVNFDFRGFDTLGEEFIFFTSVTGVFFILSQPKEHREERGAERQEEGRSDAGSSAAIRWFATGLCALIAATAMNAAAHATITPGGGFQGGAMFGSAMACIYLGVGLQAMTRVANKELLDALEGFGAFCYAAIGAATALATGFFLNNVLPLGQIGALVSGGTVQLVNAAVFVEIACGFTALLLVFVKQTHQAAEQER